MDYQIHQPGGPLRQYVKALWTMELELAPGETAVERVAPNGCACLMVHFGDLPQVVGPDGARTAQLRAHVSGQKTSFTDLEVSGKVGMVAVILRPEAIGTLLGLPATDLSQGAVDVGGAVSLAPDFTPNADGVLIYFDGTGKLDELLERVVNLGGEVVLPACEIGAEGRGSFALFKDTEGNRLGFHAD